MNGVYAFLSSCGDDCLDVEIGFCGMRRADIDRVVRQPDGEHVGIRVAVRLDCANAQFLGGPHDANRDLAAIGDQQVT